MRRDPALGNAFMDVAFAGAMLSTISIVVAMVSGTGVNLGMLGVGFVTYGAYLIGALRVGVSPISYLRNLTKRSRQ